MRDWFQVCRVHTSGIAAKVVEFQSLGDRPNEKVVSNAMRHGLSAFQAELAITTGGE